MVNKDIRKLYPSDWKEYQFDKLFEFCGGMSISRANLSNEGVCYLHYGDIHKSNDNYIDVDKNHDLIPKFKGSLENINEKYLLKDGDIVFADASEDYEGIGKAVVVINPKNIPFISGLHTIVARDKSELLNKGYKRFFLSDWNIRKQLMFIATGISVYGISRDNIKKIKVILPSLAEQQKIAAILSTWDKAIELKEKLIEQKKQLKKGLMQKLLTGEVRLPGFKGEWREEALGSIATVTMGQSPPSSSYNDDQDGLPLIQGNADCKNRKTSPRAWTSKPTKICEIGDIIMTVRAPVGYISMSNHRACIGRGVCAIRGKINQDFLYYQLIFKEDWWNIISQGSTFDSVNSKDIKELKIHVPPEEEQKAIVDILSKIDNNIQLLEKELNELKLQKKGLMQLLLTGKVRVKV